MNRDVCTSFWRQGQRAYTERTSRFDKQIINLILILSKVILWNFTDQGIKNRKDCLQSVEFFKGYVERMGNPFHGKFYSFGQYDAVSLLRS